MIEVYLTLLENEDSGKVIEFNDAFFDDNLLKINEWKGLEVAEV